MSKKGATEQLKRYIANDILNGGTQITIVQKITEDVYGVGYTLSEHSAKDLIAKVRKDLREDWAEERKHLQEIQMQRLLDLYTESREALDRLSALNTLKEMNKMCGLYEPDKVSVEAKVDSKIVIDFGFNNNEEEDEQ